MLQKDVLILGTVLPDNASVINDYLFSFHKYSRHRFFYMTRLEEWNVGFDFNRFDAVLLFWSCPWFALDLPAQLFESIAGARGLKILMLQDEYRRVRFTNLLMRRLGINVILTNAAPRDHELFYPKLLIPSLRHVSTVLTGYVPEYLERLQAPPWEDRRIDVGYRSRRVPYWLGDLGQEKRWIAERFARICSEEGLSQDISVREEDRIYGDAWLDFLCSCKFVLGTESGASLIDFDGEMEQRCADYLAANPRASYEECKQALFPSLDWQHTLRTISPRAFEAAACGNVMVMHEGDYSGFLRPDVHYISIRKDYSNLPEVLARMRDKRFCESLRENSYRDLIASGHFRYKTFIEEVDTILDQFENESAAGRRRCSPTGFYLTGYLKHGNTVIPFGEGYLVPPSWGRWFRVFWLCQELLKQPALLVCLPLLCWIILHGVVRKVRKRIRQRRRLRGPGSSSCSSGLLPTTAPPQQGTPSAQVVVGQPPASPRPERRLLFGLLHNCYHGLMTLAVFRKVQMGSKVYGERLQLLPSCSPSGRLLVFRAALHSDGSEPITAKLERMGQLEDLLRNKQHRIYRFDYSRFSGTLPLQWLGWFSVPYFPPRRANQLPELPVFSHVCSLSVVCPIGLPRFQKTP